MSFVLQCTRVVDRICHVIINVSCPDVAILCHFLRWMVKSNLHIEVHQVVRYL